jgi:hypothetical protein
MTTTLAEVRSSVFVALSEIESAQTYRTRRTSYQYPALIVGWPQSMDFRPDMGTGRDVVLDIGVACEVTDDESSDDALSDLLEEAVAALQSPDNWDVQPATDFGEELLGDGRVVIWCRLPLAVWT